MPLSPRSNRIPAKKPAGPVPAQVLTKVPRRSLTPEEQLAALAQVQRQAEQRVKLGQQLFKAAEARLSGQSDVLERVRAEQDKLREQVQQDVAQSLQSYDQWMGRIDEGFTRAIAQLGDRLDRVEQEMAGSRSDMESMLAHASALLEQTQRLLDSAFGEDDADALPTKDDGHPPSIPPAPVIDPNEGAGGAASCAADPIAADHGATDEPGGPGVFGRLLDQLRQGRDDDEELAA